MASNESRSKTPDPDCHKSPAAGWADRFAGRLLIAIPVYNERHHLHPTDGQSAYLLDLIRTYATDVLLVDDGSTDGTGEILEQFAKDRPGLKVLRHPSNMGYGRSLIDAFAYAADKGFEWVITMDADGQHEPEALPCFGRLIDEDHLDVISGSRYLRPHDLDDLPPVERRGVNITVTRMLNELFGWELTDAFCGYKAHRVSAMKELKLDETGYAFPLQFWPRCHEAGLRIEELPVKLIYNDPNRHFGGNLDDVKERLRHYLDVFAAEVAPLGITREQVEEAACEAAPREILEAVPCG